MMQLVVPDVLSLLCARLVKAMAALISLQYVSSLPFIFSFCATPTPALLLMALRNPREITEERAVSIYPGRQWTLCSVILLLDKLY